MSEERTEAWKLAEWRKWWPYPTGRRYGQGPRWAEFHQLLNESAALTALEKELRQLGAEAREGADSYLTDLGELRAENRRLQSELAILQGERARLLGVVTLAENTARCHGLYTSTEAALTGLVEKMHMVVDGRMPPPPTPDNDPKEEVESNARCACPACGRVHDFFAGESGVGSPKDGGA